MYNSCLRYFQLVKHIEYQSVLKYWDMGKRFSGCCIIFTNTACHLDCSVQMSFFFLLARRTAYIPFRLGIEQPTPTCLGEKCYVVVVVVVVVG